MSPELAECGSAASQATIASPPTHWSWVSDLAFAKRTVEARVAKRTAPFDAGTRHVALDRGEFERERPHRLCKACQHFGLESLDVDFDEGRLAMLSDQGIKRRHRHLNCSGPTLGFPTRSIVRGADKFPGGRRNRRVARIDHQICRSGLPADGNGLDGHGGISAVKQFQHRDHRRLRLNRNHTRTQTAEGSHAIANVRAHIENEIAILDELAVEAIHGGGVRAIAVVDAK